MSDRPDPSAPPGTGPRPLALLAATAFAFAAAGLLEGALLGADDRVSVALHAAALTGVPGGLIGLALAAVLPANAARWRNKWARTMSPGASRETEASALIGSAAQIAAWALTLLPVAIAAAMGGRIAHGFVQPRFVGPFVALAALGGALVSTAIRAPLEQAVARLLGKLLPRGRVGALPVAAVFLVAGALMAGGLSVLLVRRVELESGRLGWTLWVVLATVVGLVGARAFRGPRGTKLALVALGFALVTTTWGLETFADSEAARRVLPRDGTLSRVTLQFLRTALDRDGDGVSAALGGGDCDDRNPDVAPGKPEIPGNGLDDNCEGGDAPLEPEIPEVAAPAPAPSPTAASGAPGATAPNGKKWNIVLILIDTLRADHVGAYGYGRPTTPNIDEFAQAATLFRHAVSAAPNTPRSMPSIFTGRYPSRVHWVKRFANYSEIKAGTQTFFSLAHDQGYRTEVQSAHWYWEKVSALKAGVDKWDNRGALGIAESNTQSAAPEITPRVVERLHTLAKGDKPFLLFAHYFEPHGRYMNHPEVKQFGTSLMDKYDSEIAFVDHHLAPVLAALNEPGLRENTLVILSSDHGESFREHGFNFHGRTVYQDEIAIPMLIRAPAGVHREIETVVSLVDLLPTAAEVAGAKCADCQGASLLPLLTDPAAHLADRVVYAEQLPYPNYEVHMVAALAGNRRKLVRNVTENTLELFDLPHDAFEKVNVLSAEVDGDKALRQSLSRFIEGDPGG